nr:hypothetical protein CFP56_47862 [Quercus suber]
MLDHGEKDCVEKTSLGNKVGEGCMQYGAWLRGELGRRAGKDQGRMEEENKPEFRSGRVEMTVEKPARETSRQRDKTRTGGSHVDGQSACQDDGQNQDSEKARVMRQVLEFDHENGKVNLQQEKGEEGLDKRGMVSLTNTFPIADLESIMHWEGTNIEVEASKPAEKKTNTEVGDEMGLELKENIS